MNSTSDQWNMRECKIDRLVVEPLASSIAQLTAIGNQADVIKRLANYFKRFTFWDFAIARQGIHQRLASTCKSKLAGLNQSTSSVSPKRYGPNRIQRALNKSRTWTMKRPFNLQIKSSTICCWRAVIHPTWHSDLRKWGLHSPGLYAALTCAITPLRFTFRFIGMGVVDFSGTMVESAEMATTDCTLCWSRWAFSSSVFSLFGSSVGMWEKFAPCPFEWLVLKWCRSCAAVNSQSLASLSDIAERRSYSGESVAILIR